MEITLSESAKQYIAERTDAARGFYEYTLVISQKDALEAAERVKQETKENCENAFRCVITNALLANASGKPIDIEAELKKQINSI